MLLCNHQYVYIPECRTGCEGLESPGRKSEYFDMLPPTVIYEYINITQPIQELIYSE